MSAKNCNELVIEGTRLTSCRVRRSLNSRVLTAVQSCCISLSGTASNPGGKGSSSLPGLSPQLQSAGSKLVGRLGSLEEEEEWKKVRAIKSLHVIVWVNGKTNNFLLLPTALHRDAVIINNGVDYVLHGNIQPLASDRPSWFQNRDLVQNVKR